MLSLEPPGCSRSRWRVWGRIKKSILWVLGTAATGNVFSDALLKHAQSLTLEKSLLGDVET